MIKFSIITPSFNQGKYLEETILSVINQSYKNVEHIVIDGGSSDQSIEIIKKYEKHLAYWISEKDSGQSEAINKGLKQATGDVITWLNSDDYYEKNSLQLIADEFENNPDVSVIHGSSILFGPGIKNQIIRPEKILKVHDYLPYMRFPQPSCFLKKEVFAACGNINQSLHYGMDFELIVKSILLGFHFKQINTTLSYYRLHENSKSNNDLLFLIDWSKILGNALCSLTNGTLFLTKLESLNLITAKECKPYPVTISLSVKELEEVFLEHLYLQYHYNYRIFNTTLCKTLSDYLRINYPSFYKEKKFRKYDLRLKYIPKMLFKLVRK